MRDGYGVAVILAGVGGMFTMILAIELALFMWFVATCVALDAWWYSPERRDAAQRNRR